MSAQTENELFSILRAAKLIVMVSKEMRDAEICFKLRSHKLLHSMNKYNNPSFATMF
jgi:hypothetical protein